MTTVAQILRRTIERHPRVGAFLLGCGVISSVWWIAIDVVASRRYPRYSYFDQTVSELSAEGAPTRHFMIAANAFPYGLFTTGFGVGVWMAAGRARAGRITGALLVGGAVIGIVGGLLFPMMVRGTKGDLRNAMHAPYGAVSILLFLLTMGLGSRLLGKRFRYYSYGTIGIMLVFGTLMGLQSSRMVANEPTPWMGLEERIAVYATMLWFALLAIGLLRAETTETVRHLKTSTVIPAMLKRIPQ